MSVRPGYVTVQVSIRPDPIEVPIDEVEVLRSQGLLVTTPPPPPAEPAPEPLAAGAEPAPVTTFTRKARS
jgi:hypothetical protein